MLLITGLGNPGRRYAKNRHNIGFLALEKIAAHYRFPPFRERFHGLWSEGSIEDLRLGLLMPQTFMNESGQSVAAAQRFYKLENCAVIVLHDELDLPPHTLRVKIGGGNAGHNGLRSISAHIGNDYKRVRLGIGHPGAKELVNPFVLGDFLPDETPGVEALCEAVARSLPTLLKGDNSTFQNQVHLAMKDL